MVLHSRWQESGEMHQLKPWLSMAATDSYRRRAIPERLEFMPWGAWEAGSAPMTCYDFKIYGYLCRGRQP